jgi:hypothetical protein
MSTPSDRKRWSELASVSLAAIAGAFLLFEILRTYLPSYLKIAIERSDVVAGWTLAAAIGLSILFTGIGVLIVSALRLFLALRKAEAAVVQIAAKDHLGSAIMVIVGLVLSVGTLYVLSQMRP